MHQQRDLCKKGRHHLSLLIHLQLLKVGASFRSRLLHRLCFLGQRFPFTGSDVHFRFLCIDLCGPRLQVFLFGFNLVMENLRLVYAPGSTDEVRRQERDRPFRLSRIPSRIFSSLTKECSNASNFPFSLSIFSTLSSIVWAALTWALLSCRADLISYLNGIGVYLRPSMISSIFWPCWWRASYVP
jgi:hypothetical protein